jgi:hypothetical protein
METPRVPRPQGRRSLFWPVALITFGILLLLSNMGIIPATGWAILWRFWPVALIALGIDVLIGRRSVAGAIAGGILLLFLVGLAIGMALFAEQIPFLVELARPAEMHFDHLAYPLDGIGRAAVTINYTSAPGHLQALADSPNLLEADVAYRGDLAFTVERVGAEATITLDTQLQGISYGNLSFDDRDYRWDIGLAPEVALDLRLNTASGRTDIDLAGLNLVHLILDAGSGAVDLVLPSDRSLEADIHGGSGTLTLHVPPDVGLRISLASGSGRFDPGEHLVLVSGERDGDGTWESANFERADYRISLTLDQGSGAVRIR